MLLVIFRNSKFTKSHIAKAKVLDNILSREPQGTSTNSKEDKKIKVKTAMNRTVMRLMRQMAICEKIPQS